MTEHIIENIKSGSIASDLGIEKGDVLLSINSTEVNDIIDYKFLESGNQIKLLIRKKDNSEYLYDIEKEYDEDLGLEFKTATIDNLKHCKNKCVFCFIDQLPKNMRNSLLFKDDDYRLSFLQGNFVTLTNMNDKEFERIIKYKMSPIYISVHATDDEVRKKIMNNPNSIGILNKLKKLITNGIEIHCQIVLCPGLNDGKILDKTIYDLSSMYPGVKTAASVPVGLTDHREGLYELKSYNKESASEVILQVTKWQKKLKSEIGSSFIFLSDEFYVLADKEIPDYTHYEGFPQIENGVGLMALFKKQFFDYLNHIKKIVPNSKRYRIVTGVSSYKFMKSLSDILNRYGLNTNVTEIINDFFGHKITVTGLTTGTDIINQLKGKLHDETIILPSCMFRDDSEVFLDDKTLEDVKRELKTDIVISKVNGKDFIDTIIH